MTATVTAADVFTDNHQLPVGRMLDQLYRQARQLMDEHGLNDWDLVFGGARAATLGFTRHDHKRITLSAPLMAAVPGAERRDTVLHEIAHALCPRSEKHGQLWKQTARRIGANPASRSHAEEVMEARLNLPVAATCPAGHEWGRATMPKPARRNLYHCTHPSHRGQTVEQKRITFTWRQNTEPLDPQIAAAIRRHSKPLTASQTAAESIRFSPGDTVTIHGTGSPTYDGLTGTVVSVARVNCVIKVPGMRRHVRVRATYLR